MWHVPFGDGTDHLKKLGYLWIARDTASSDVIGRNMGWFDQHGGVVANVAQEVVVCGIIVTHTVVRLPRRQMEGDVSEAEAPPGGARRDDTSRKTTFLLSMIRRAVRLKRGRPCYRGCTQPIVRQSP